MSIIYKQVTVQLAARARGCHLITKDIVGQIQSQLRTIDVGLAHMLLQHTSASLTLNENADSDVRHDMESMLNYLVPEKGAVKFRHDAEGDDDMPAHVKCSLLSPSVTIPITNGRLALGTWQGIWLCEHRNDGGKRSIVVTMHGQSSSRNDSDDVDEKHTTSRRK